MYARTHARAHAHTRIHTHTHVCTYAHIYHRRYLCIPQQTNVYVYTPEYTYICASILHGVYTYYSNTDTTRYFRVSYLNQPTNQPTNLLLIIFATPGVLTVGTEVVLGLCALNATEYDEWIQLVALFAVAWTIAKMAADRARTAAFMYGHNWLWNFTLIPRYPSPFLVSCRGCSTLPSADNDAEFLHPLHTHTHAHIFTYIEGPPLQRRRRYYSLSTSSSPTTLTIGRTQAEVWSASSSHPES